MSVYTAIESGKLVHTKNPDEFKAILKDRAANSELYHGYWI
jgi:hypothetical protein